MKKLICVFLACIVFLTAAACAKQISDSAEQPELKTYFLVDDEVDELAKTSIAFSEGNRFTFTFSMLSSYLCAGTYTVDGSTLTLNDESGGYHYTFNIVDNTLVFVAAESSEPLWGADFSDGAVFK